MGGQIKRKFSLLRLILITGLIAVILLGAALLIVPRFIPWEKLKVQAQAKISEAIHHQVSIESIGFNLFKGIEVRKLRIENAKGFSETPFLTDESVSVQYRLLPLLVGKVAIKAVVLNKPHVLIEKKADNTFNFSDMLPAKKEKAAKVEALEAKKGLPAIPVELLISKFAINDAKVVYRDLGRKQEYTIETLNLLVENLTLAGLIPVKVHVDAKLKALGQTYPLNLDTSWRFNYAKEKFKLDSVQVTLPGIRLEAAGEVSDVVSAPYLNLAGKTNLDFQKVINKLTPLDVKKKIPEDIQVKGTAAVTFSVKGPAKQVDQLQITANNDLAVNLDIKGLQAPLGIKGDISLKSSNVKIKQAITLPGISAQLETKLNDILETRQLWAQVNGKINVAECAAKLIPPAIMKKITHLQTNGSISYKLKIQGQMEKPKALDLDCSVKVRDVQVSYQDKMLLEGFGTNITIQPKQIAIKKIKAKLTGQPLDGYLTVTGLDLRDPRTLKPDTLQAQMKWKLNSQMLDLDAMFALLPRQEKKKPEKGGQQADAVLASEAEVISDRPEPDVRKFIPPGLKINGKASLGGIKFGQVKLGQVDFSMRQAKQKINATASVRGYQGRIENATVLDYSKSRLSYAVSTKVTGVDLETLMNDMVDTFVAAKLKKPKIISELKDKLTGRLTGKLKIAGKGIRTQNAMKHLNGKGEFALKAGRIRQFAFQDNLAKWFGSDKFRQDIPFDNTDIVFVIGRKKVNLTKFIMESGVQGKSGDIRMTAKGKITFEAEFEKFKLRPRLNPRAAGTISPEFRQYSEILKDDRGWLTIPVILDGPIKKPRVNPDWEWIKNQLGSYAKKKAKAAQKQAEKKAKQFVEQQKGKSAKEVQENLNKEVEKAKESIKKLDFKNLFK
ncbi:AsmA family protein [bacterium]|nr:AsmA family protein [bacterium]